MFLKSGRPPGARDGPQIKPPRRFEGLPGPPGPARPQKPIPKRSGQATFRYPGLWDYGPDKGPDALGEGGLSGLGVRCVWGTGGLREGAPEGSKEAEGGEGAGRARFLVGEGCLVPAMSCSRAALQPLPSPLVCLSVCSGGAHRGDHVFQLKHQRTHACQVRIPPHVPAKGR